MAERVFTVVQANRILPTVEEAIRYIRAKAREIIRTQDRIGVLTLIGAETAGSPENRELAEARNRLHALAERYNARLEELEKIGCVVKDLNHGLVDFYARKDDRLVFLCWKLGEKRISFWHELEGGFTGRRPIREFESADEEED